MFGISFSVVWNDLIDDCTFAHGYRKRHEKTFLGPNARTNHFLGWRVKNGMRDIWTSWITDKSTLHSMRECHFKNLYCFRCWLCRWQTELYKFQCGARAGHGDPGAYGFLLVLWLPSWFWGHHLWWLLYACNFKQIFNSLNAMMIAWMLGCCTFCQKNGIALRIRLADYICQQGEIDAGAHGIKWQRALPQVLSDIYIYISSSVEVQSFNR